MKYLLMFLMMWAIAGCTLIFEDDLSTQKVPLLSPPNGYRSPTQTQTFVWDSLPGVSQYRFQLVSQRFDFIEQYVLDTILSGTRLTLSLLPKAYEWRVIGRNNSSETDADPWALTIVQDTSLVNQLVNLIAPTPGTIYPTDSVAFLWVSLALADQYQLQVATDPSFNSQTIVTDTLVPRDFVYLLRRLGLGIFHYRIRAMRVGTDTTLFTPVQQFQIDVVPLHQTPANNSTPTLPLNMAWVRASNVAKDSLFLYHNSTTTPYQRLELTGNNYTFDNQDTIGRGPGVYYWQVKSVGTNGVESNRSNLWQFTLN